MFKVRTEYFLVDLIFSRIVPHKANLTFPRIRKWLNEVKKKLAIKQCGRWMSFHFTLYLFITGLPEGKFQGCHWVLGNLSPLSQKHYSMLAISLAMNGFL